jgi:hypothetical protein
VVFFVVVVLVPVLGLLEVVVVVVLDVWPRHRPLTARASTRVAIRFISGTCLLMGFSVRCAFFRWEKLAAVCNSGIPGCNLLTPIYRDNISES